MSKRCTSCWCMRFSFQSAIDRYFVIKGQYGISLYP